MSYQGGVEFTYYITPDGVQYALGGGARHALGWRGLGHLPPEYITSRGPFQDGLTIRGYRYGARVIDFDLWLGGDCRDDFWNHYARLADMLRPNRAPVMAAPVISGDGLGFGRSAPAAVATGAASGPGRLLFVTSDGTEREIFAWIQSGPALEWDGRGNMRPSDTEQLLSWLCPVPWFRNPEQQSVVVTISPIEALVFYESPDYTDTLIFPFSFGEAVINVEETITYLGNYKAYPTIEIRGPLASPSVRNETTGEEIALGYTVAAGETVTIDLDYNNQGIKRVTNNAGEDLIGAVLNPNDLATFHLEVDPVAEDGENVLSFSGAGAVSGQSAITVSYYEQYMGVPK